MASSEAKIGATKHAFIVEHLDPELEAWQLLEYTTISRECTASNATFILSGLSQSTQSETSVRDGLKGVTLSTKSVDDLITEHNIPKERVCLLDPRGEQDLGPADGDAFDVFVFGGILGDDPPRDRTAELRVKGFRGRRLGKEQLTTDTAARVTRIVVQEGVALNDVPYVDRPDFHVADGETISMPFKYVKDKDGKPILPEGMLELLADDADKGILDLL